MEILIISKSRGTAGQVRVNVFGLSLLMILLTAVAASVAYWAYVKGGDEMAALILNSPERSATVWQREIIEQRKFLQAMKQDLNADLSAFSSSVGSLQGELGRLDAAAERVLESSGLDAAEFAFGEPVPIGGPRPRASLPPDWASMLDNLSELQMEIELRETKLSMLESFLFDKQIRDDIEPTGVPVPNGWISSGYGYRTDPVNGRREFHDGIDFAGKPGLEVRAVAPGLVTWSGKRWGYGNLVELNHGNGYVTRYAHNRANLVKVGEKVEKNQTVALLGSSGRTTGPHVHFEVMHNDQTINPRRFVNSSPE